MSARLQPITDKAILQYPELLPPVRIFLFCANGCKELTLTFCQIIQTHLLLCHRPERHYGDKPAYGRRNVGRGHRITIKNPSPRKELLRVRVRAKFS
jgi:hypothetical protein